MLRLNEKSCALRVKYIGLFAKWSLVIVDVVVVAALDRDCSLNLCGTNLVLADVD